MDEIASSIWAVGGGKGDVGKSFFASCLACALAMDGKDVILIDADLSEANLHSFFGIQSLERTLKDFIKDRVGDIREVLISTPFDNLKLIGGGIDILELSNPLYSQKQRLTNAISGLGADYIIIDIGAAVSSNNLDFFNMAAMGFIVTSPEPLSVQNAYGFLKLALLRRVISQFYDNHELRSRIASMLEGKTQVRNMNEMLDALKKENKNAYEKVIDSIKTCNYKLVLNLATAEEGDKAARTMVSAVNHFLKINLNYIGAIDIDREAKESVRAIVPLVLKHNSPITNSMMDIVQRVTANGRPKTVKLKQPSAAAQEPTAPLTRSASKMQVGLNNDVNRHGTIIHVQTEDLGFDKEKILTLAFSDGRILFTKTTDYSELGQDNLQKNIIDRVNWQHRAVLTGIQTGKLDEKLGSEEK